MGEVEHVGRREVRLGDGEVLGRSLELGSIGRSPDVNEVGRGDGEVLGRSAKLGSARRSPKVNEVERGDGEVLRRSVALDGTSWGNASQWEVDQDDREVLEKSVELGDARRSPEVNDDSRRA